MAAFAPESLPPHLNFFHLTGRVKERQSIKVTSKGVYLLEFTVAARRWMDDGSERTEDFGIEAWGALAAELDGSLRPGMSVYLHGVLTSREVDDRGKIRHLRISLKAKGLEILGD